MIVVKLRSDSEFHKLKALGVVERLKKPEWAADQRQMPFNQKEYGHQYKTITRGLRKRT